VFGRGEQSWSHLSQWPEPPHCLLLGHITREALSDEHLYAHGEVESNLIIRFGFDAATPA
jgi:hypothetical protein